MKLKQQDDHIDMSKQNRRNLPRALMTGMIIAVVFLVGVNVGNGRIRLNHGPKNTQNSSLPAQLDYSSVNEVYKTLKENYDGKLTETQLLDGLKEGLALATKDPYTEYFTTSENKDYLNQVDGTFSGIGAQLGKNAEGNLEVIAPIAGTPADKAGLKAKDVITHINGVSTANMSIESAVRTIRGKNGTSVELKIVRDAKDTLTLKIVRSDITVPSVTARKLDSGIGYIQISQFSSDTATLVNKEAQKLKSEQIKGVILDLRSNPGGRLEAAVGVSDLWLPAGKTILQQKQGNTVIDTQLANGKTVLEGMPTVVLIDGGSASAAEIVAGALHDNNAATLIGTKTYGKGVVQEVIPLRDGGGLKVTVASWYRPNGQNINKKGIMPDVTVELSATDLKNGIDTQLQAAISKLTSQ